MTKRTSLKNFNCTEKELNARHADKMRKKKIARDKIMATKTIKKGLLIVHTGKGKGKSTAGFGIVFRSLGHGHNVGIVQFIKGRIETGERIALKHFSNLVTIKRMGDGFTWETQDRQRDIDAARQAWETTKEMIRSRKYQLILCDELNIVLRYDYLPISDVVDFLKTEKPEDVHVVITGRNAKDQLVEIADLVTDMTQIKHPFRSGMRPQEGIEF